MLKTITTKKWIRGLDKQPRKRKTMAPIIISCIPLTSTINFMGSITSECPSSSNITTLHEGETIIHAQDKSNLNIELFVIYCGTSDIWNKANIEIDESFICMIAKNLFCEKDDLEPNTIDEAMHCFDWLIWKVAIEEDYASLQKRHVFGPIVNNFSSQILGYKLVFVHKCDDKDNIVHYKVHLIAQGFTQKFGTDYDSTYSPVMDSITFQYLLGMAIHTILEMRLMDVVTAYLYGSLHANIYM